MQGKIVLVSGPCGSGKTTVCRLLTQNSEAVGAVHMHTDDFYSYIKKDPAAAVHPQKKKSAPTHYAKSLN